MTFRRRWPFLILCLTLMAVSAHALYARPGSDKPFYKTVKVFYGSIENSVLAAGRLDAAERVNVGAQVSGQIKSIWVKSGDRVKKGQLIADIDDQTQRNELRTAVTALDVAKANVLAKQVQLDQATKRFVRQRNLFHEGASSEQDFEDAETGLALTRAELNALKALSLQAQIDVEKKQVELSYTHVLAPMDGIVIAVIARQGQTVNSSQSAPTIIKLARLDVMTIKAQVSEVDIMHIHAGQEAYFTTFAEPDKQYKAILRSVELAPESLMADDGIGSESSSSNTKSSVYYNVLLDVPNPENTLRIAMSAQVSLILQKSEKSLLVPFSSVMESSPGKKMVRVLNEKMQPEFRSVITGITDRVNFQILSGLKAGESVVVPDLNK